MSDPSGSADERSSTGSGIRTSGPRAEEVPPTTNWVIVVPVKGTSRAKSRFGPGDNSALALAMAADTVAAAMEARGVARVLVVTTAEASAVFVDLGASVVVQETAGLAAAISLGVATAVELSESGGGIAVLLGDLPALTSTEFGAALTAARSHPLAMVADACGQGTALITAVHGAIHAPAFGVGSSDVHRSAGYIPLDVSSNSGLRNDVDLPEDLAVLAGRLGIRTVRALASGQHAHLD
ncbi:2-phospho-L-lactate guanylyltransferase [Frigoribacterium sp. CG_9.8]|uniref:2-phospho-L-lactate guanylyltransferase n=1 Tax=Frigoribacterium sp. CG_9.8 TaxID=2787733 RepID=UPI0018CA6068|nr:2-phospho-L-lactate guanylyltransferase [Frigoribacterium sp. CG_9.8]